MSVRPTPRPGVYRITHVPTGRRVLGTSLDVDALLNRIRFELSTGTHRNAALQRAWTEDGDTALAVEVLDTLEPGDTTPAALRDDLAQLLALWQEKLGQGGSPW